MNLQRFRNWFILARILRLLGLVAAFGAGSHALPAPQTAAQTSPVPTSPVPTLPTQTSAAQIVAQIDPNTGYTGVQIPYTSIQPNNGTVNIRFINETGSVIDYQVIGDTQFRSLGGRSQMLLERLKLPTTFTFRRADNGFLQVKLYPDSATSTITLRVRETPDFAADRTSVYIDQAGSVYLN